MAIDYGYLMGLTDRNPLAALEAIATDQTNALSTASQTLGRAANVVRGNNPESAGITAQVSRDASLRTDTQEAGLQRSLARGISTKRSINRTKKVGSLTGASIRSTALTDAANLRHL